MLSLPFISIVLSRVPVWVWALLALILVMGLIQSRDQRMTRARLVMLPLAWLGFGAWGVLSTFGLHAAPLLAWLATLASAVWLLQRSGWPGAARFETAQQRFFVPGSWWPLALMLGIFTAKFALGMSLALEPGLAHSAPVAGGFSALFGALSGVFLGRSRNILASA
jgi:hypothetical protein